MSAVLIILAALLIYAVFAVLRARDRTDERVTEVETEARMAAAAERFSAEAEAAEIAAAKAERR